MLNENDLADIINNAIAATDKDNNPISTTAEMMTYSSAIITTFQSAMTTHLVGTVTGVTTAGAPLANGAAMNGLLLNFLSATWLGVMTSGFPTANPANLNSEASASTGYISGAAMINFASGTITGTCTSTPVAPGPLVAGAGTMGTVDDLMGSDWASAVIPPMGDSVLTENIYNAIVNYINTNAEVEYITGSVTGTCPPAAGPLAAGTAIGGLIS